MRGPIKMQPRYGCSFCRKIATKPTIERHEKICYKNPDRFCPTCQNTGLLPQEYEPGIGWYPQYPCPYCSKQAA